MDKKIIDRLSFIRNRCQLCFYKKYEYLENYQNFLWEYISKILYFYDERVHCPICFSKPFLPRMDRCGHIFCLLCLRKLFQHSGHNSVICPVCKDMQINVNSLKRVSFIRNKVPKIGDSISFRLLVKDRPNSYPRPAECLYKLSVNQISSVASEMGNSTGIGIDQNRTVIEAIKSDIQSLKSRKVEKGSNEIDIVKLSIDNLEREMEEMLEKGQESSGDEGEDRENEKEGEKKRDKVPRGVREIDKGEMFNLLEVGLRGTQGSRARLFYGCRGYRLMFLDRSQTDWLLGSASGGAEGGPPVTVTGKIAALRTERVSMADGKGDAVMAAGGRAPFEGALVTVLRLDTGLRSQLTMGRADWTAVRELRWHRVALREESARCERFKEEMAAIAVARRTDSLSGGVSRMMTSMMEAMKRNSAPLSSDITSVTRTPVIKTTTDSVFNTCMIGIDCVDPDDEYPHAETCPYFCPLIITESSPLQLPQQSQQSSQSSSQSQSSTPSQSPPSEESLVINNEKEMCFGLLQLKLNVYHPEKSHEPIDEPINPTDVRVKAIHNHPPERIVNSELPPSLAVDNLKKYMVQKKTSSQRELKKNRKSQKINRNLNQIE